MKLRNKSKNESFVELENLPPKQEKSLDVDPSTVVIETSIYDIHSKGMKYYILFFSNILSFLSILADQGLYSSQTAAATALGVSDINLVFSVPTALVGLGKPSYMYSFTLLLSKSKH